MFSLSTVKNKKGCPGFIESCGKDNMLDNSQDDTVWYDNSEETEDAEDIIYNEVETESEGEDNKYMFTNDTALFRATKSNEVNN